MRFEERNEDRQQTETQQALNTACKQSTSDCLKSARPILALIMLVTVLLSQLAMPAIAGRGDRGGDNRAARSAARAQRVQQRAASPNPRQARRAARAPQQDATKAMRQASRQSSRQVKALRHSNKVTQKRSNASVNKTTKAIRKQEQRENKTAVRNSKKVANLQTRAYKQDLRVDNTIRRRAIKAGRWDAKLDNKSRYRAYRKYRNNWASQRAYLNTNLSHFNQLAAINAAQQAQLDNQMRAAYLAYHNNNYAGLYNWTNYSNPQFLDYLQNRQPSLLQQILAALGLGINDNYLYSPNWGDERSQLAQNMGNIHQLAVQGRITSLQEQNLINQMQPQYMAYTNNQFNGVPTWSQYSNPGFLDYLNTRQPSILATVRDYLIR